MVPFSYYQIDLKEHRHVEATGADNGLAPS
jgi:hypothetical protein